VTTIDNHAAHAFRKTGVIWRKRLSNRKNAVRSVCRNLTMAYGNPRFGNPPDPLDDLIYIILSNKTSPRTARKIYRTLQERFTKWDEILSAPGFVLRALLKPAGLSVVKSRHIRGALRSIERRFGVCSLASLKGFTPEAAEDFLIGLPGVSEKVAKCVMMYTLNIPVLPVDTHVHRISVRLGWTARKRADQCHAELEALVPPQLRMGFHVACIAHGRRVCRPLNPLCHDCRIRRLCAFFKATQ
jgi:endonuclease III